MRRGFEKVRVSTNIGEVQQVRASACQAALGVATAGADFIKFGLAEQSIESATYLASIIVRTVRKLAPGKRVYPALFVDEDMVRFLEPLEEGPVLAQAASVDGVLIDTFNKQIGKGLMDYCKVDQIAEFVEALHSMKKEAWIAGSITPEELPALWETGVDVICVRGAACAPDKGSGRFGEVRADIIEQLVLTIPSSPRKRMFLAKDNT